MAPPKKGGGLNLGSAPPPPASKPKNQTTGAAFNAFINAHPTMRPYADTIWKWAGTYGVDKVVAAALFWRESFAAAKATGQDPATITSPKGAVGIGQIMPLHVGEKTPWGHTITQSDLVNPDFNIRWSMFYFSEGLQKFGNSDAAYSRWYNNGYTGPALTTLLPKQYVPRSGLSPTDKGTVTAETQAATQAAKAQVFDKWAVLDKGAIKFVSITDPNQPPKNILTYGGAPLTKTSFTQTWNQPGGYADTYAAYAGRRPKPSEVAKVLASGISTYALANQLALEPGFSKSPVYLKHAPGLVAIARDVLGNDWKPSGALIRQAITQSWDEATFLAHVRQLPAYQNGPEFKTNLAHNTAQFEQVYGINSGDAAVSGLIRNVTAKGWTPDQFALWLRQQPAYKSSPEFQSKTLSFLTQMGLITGAVPTLSGDQVDQMLHSGDQLPGVAPEATGPGAAPNRPDNRPGPRGANPMAPSPPLYPPPPRPDDRAGVRGA